MKNSLMSYNWRITEKIMHRLNVLSVIGHAGDVGYQVILSITGEKIRKSAIIYNMDSVYDVFLIYANSAY